MSLISNKLLILCIVVMTQANALQDSDMDGVPDKKDACPDTPMQMAVMANGCIDPDNIDIAELAAAPNANAGDNGDTSSGYLGSALANVDLSLCKDGLSTVADCLQNQLSPVYFDFGKDEVLLTELPTIENVKRIFASNAKLRLLLVGHADLVGNDQLNQALSLARANSVKQVLVNQFNFDPENISVKGMSNTQPVANNATLEGRQRNRRVEFKISAE